MFGLRLLALGFPCAVIDIRTDMLYTGTVQSCGKILEICIQVLPKFPIAYELFYKVLSY